MNHLAATTPSAKAFGQVFNTAVGERFDLNRMVQLIKTNLAEYDSKIVNVEVKYGPQRQGDIPHSLASIEKAKRLLGYQPDYTFEEGLKEALEWYWNNLQL